MCINLGIIVISVTNTLTNPVTFTVTKITFLGYPKVIPYTKFEYFEIIRFWVMLWANRQTNRRSQTFPLTPTDSVDVGKNNK